jgi:hypothetical protein
MTNDLTALSEAATKQAIALEAHVMDSWQLTLVFGTGDVARDQMRAFSDAYRAGDLVPNARLAAATARAEAAEAENARLREALKWYADRPCYLAEGVVNVCTYDDGERARQALGGEHER